MLTTATLQWKLKTELIRIVTEKALVGCEVGERGSKGEANVDVTGRVVEPNKDDKSGDNDVETYCEIGAQYI